MDLDESRAGFHGYLPCSYLSSSDKQVVFSTLEHENLVIRAADRLQRLLSRLVLADLSITCAQSFAHLRSPISSRKDQFFNSLQLPFGSTPRLPATVMRDPLSSSLAL